MTSNSNSDRKSYLIEIDDSISGRGKNRFKMELTEQEKDLVDLLARMSRLNSDSWNKPTVSVGNYFPGDFE